MRRLVFLLVALSLLFVCVQAENTSAADMIAFGSQEAATTLLQLDAQSSAFMQEHDADSMLGEPINAAIGAILLAAYENAQEEAGVSAEIQYVGTENADIEALLQIVREAVKLSGIGIRFVLEGETEIVYNAKDGAPSVSNCALCNGEGILTCGECNGSGERLTIVQREREVRNDYVCEICDGTVSLLCPGCGSVEEIG